MKIHEPVLKRQHCVRMPSFAAALVWVVLPAALTFFSHAVYCRAEAPQAPEYDVKAAFIYNFAKFVEWPAETFRNAESPLVLCVYGKGAVEKAFGEVSGKKAMGRVLVVRFNDGVEEPETCNIIFVSVQDRKRSAAVLESVRGRSILTVGETPDFIQHGGVINFISRGNKIRFEINPGTAKRVRLSISSQLLRLADIAKER